MTVFEFNQILAREKLIAPDDAIVRIIERLDDEIKIEVQGKITWIKARKRARVAYRRYRGAPDRSWEEYVAEDRPAYRMDRDEISLGPAAYMLLQWIKSLEHPKFSIQYAARELNLSDKTIRKGLQLIRSKGMMPQ